jgi:hypothetical protein
MNSAAPSPSSSLPGLFSLYHRDQVIRLSLNAFGFGLLVVGGIQWASQPVPGAPKNDSMPFGVPEADFISMIGLGLSAVGALVLVWRFLRLRKILGQGTLITGKVEEVETSEFEVHNSSSTPNQRSYRRVYHVIVRYTAKGEERRARFKLPNSPSVYKLFKDHDVELSVLDSAPNNPLIRIIYLGRF